MARLRITISGLMIAICILAIAFASLRAHSGLGVNLVFCVALGLNFAALVIVPMDLDPRIRFAALAYAVCGWGWLALETFLPWTDSMVTMHLITPRLISWIDPGPNPNLPGPHPLLFPLSLLTHSLISIMAGSLSAFLTFSLSSRLFDPDRTTTPTSESS